MDSFDQAMSDILKQSKYNTLTGRSIDIKKSLSDLIANLLRELLSKVNINIPADQLFDNRAVTIIIVVATVFFIVMFGVLITAFMHRRRKSKALIVEELITDISGSFSHLDLVAHSNHFAASGNLREAVRYRFIALLTVLYENGLITVYKTKTNNQIIMDLKSCHPPCFAGFTGIVSIFDRAWFGHKPIPSETFERYCTDTDGIIHEYSSPDSSGSFSPIHSGGRL